MEKKEIEHYPEIKAIQSYKEAHHFDNLIWLIQLSAAPVFTEEDAKRAQELCDKKDYSSTEYQALEKKKVLDSLRRFLPDVLEDINGNDFYPQLPFGVRTNLSGEQKELLIKKIRGEINNGNIFALHAATYSRDRTLLNRFEFLLFDLGQPFNFSDDERTTRQMEKIEEIITIQKKRYKLGEVERLLGNLFQFRTLSYDRNSWDFILSASVADIPQLHEEHKQELEEYIHNNVYVKESKKNIPCQNRIRGKKKST